MTRQCIVFLAASVCAVGAAPCESPPTVVNQGSG
jgi:hypothetical protein